MHPQSSPSPRDDDAVVRVARIARDLAHLPGAATPDWCRRAAGVFAYHDHTTRAWVAVLTDAAKPVEADGFAAGASNSSQNPAPRLAPALTRLATAAAHQERLPIVETVGSLLGTLDDPPRGAGTLVRHGHIVIGLARVAAREGAALRALAVIWDRPAGDSQSTREVDTADLRLILTSVLGVASERLCQALGDSETPWLSACEQRVLDLLTAGLSVPEIAETLDRSPHTVHDHVKRLHSKLGTRSRGALLSRVLGPRRPVGDRRPGGPIVHWRTGLFVDHGAR